MSTQIQRRKGTTTEHSTFTGAEAELTVDTTKDTVVVHDGATVGGHPLQKQYPALGSAAAPTYTFTGDSNTGIYSPGADQVAISTNGTGRLFVDASGNVGVGNTVASSMVGNGITIGTGASGQASVCTVYSNSDTYGAIYFADAISGAGRYAGGVEYVHSSDALRFYTNSDERVRIDSSGRLGLGTSTPQYNLHGTGYVGLGTQASSGAGAGIHFIPSSTLTNWFAGSNYVTPGAFQIIPSTAGGGSTFTTPAVTIDSSSRVGIGTTSPDVNLHVKDSTTGRIRIEGGATYAAQLQFLPDAQTNPWVITCDPSRNLVFFDHASERARIDSSGRLLVGTSSSVSIGGGTAINQIFSNSNGEFVSLHLGFNASAGGSPVLALSRSRNTSYGSYTVVQSGDSLGRIRFTGDDGSDYNSIAALIEAQVDGTPGANDMPGRLVFSTTADGASSPTERMRISQNGNVEIRHINNGDVLNVSSTATSGYTERLLGLLFPGYAPNNTAARFLYCADTAAVRAEIRSNGGLANFSANDVNLSDRNVKKDIAPAAGTWDCLKEWEIVNFHYKDQPDDADLNLGVIAQQVAESCPEVTTVFQEAKEATEDAPAQEERLGVKEQQMMWMAIKALQEAQLRIETLEAEVAALKAS